MFKISDLRFRIFSSLCSLFLVLSFTSSIFAKEIVILYTGETHAMLYPCNCPKEPDGGVARRAALIKQIRYSYTNALLLDSGGFFAGGLQDEYTQNTQLDMERTRVNLKALELMKYDALAIGDDEFNFGPDFFQENINRINLNFLSCNLKANKVLPFIIREVGDAKIGIIGVTTLLAAQKAGYIKLIEPKIAVADAVSKLRGRGVNIIVLLSHLGENEDLNLINNVKGIDIIISGHSRLKNEPFTKINDTLILRPAFQGKKLGKVTLSVEKNKITDFKVEELRLSPQIADDPSILHLLPRCFSDNNCRKEEVAGICENPGTLSSRCIFSEPNKVNLLIISHRECVTCDTTSIVNFLKSQFPGLVVSSLYYPDTKADRMLKDFAIRGIPAYLLGKEVEKEKNFDNLKQELDLKGDYYLLKPKFTGLSYFVNRDKIKGKLDLFISLYGKETPELLKVIKEFNPVVHFLAVEEQGRFDAQNGNLEIEDYLRAVCIQKYYPEKFWEYISCRAKFINSSWWDECIGDADIDKIKSCAKAEEGEELLRENIALNKELEVMFGPAYLMDNQEIFSSRGVPDKEELRKILRR